MAKIASLGLHAGKHWELHAGRVEDRWSSFILRSEDPTPVEYYLAYNGKIFAESSDYTALHLYMPALLDRAEAVITEINQRG